VSSALTIVIPAYNEAARIGGSLTDIMRFAAGYPGGAEVIVVDDGSTDATIRVVEEHIRAAGPLLKLLRHPVNRGKGVAVRSGFEAATSPIVLFTDADLSAPISEAPRLIDLIAADTCDIAIGSRALNPALIRVNQAWIRRTMGRTFNRMVRVWTGLNIRDTQCGFKAFRREPVAPIFAAQRLHGFAFDVELLYLAAVRGLRIREVPVTWNHVADSRVSLLTDSAAMLLELIRLRVNHSRGLYAAPTPPAGQPVENSPGMTP
jgi:dolichyl-phosphate beta-glucosyltransferase